MNSLSGWRPKKRLGQHFLVDDQVVLDIIHRGGFHVSDSVLEIGPGTGALTLPLARRVDHIVAVEKDPALAELLEKKLESDGIHNVQVIREDILRFGLDEIQGLHGGRIRVAGNLPYNISSPIMELLVKNRHQIANAVFMFQHEFARRLTARPGGKEYGALSAVMQYYAGVTPLIEVPPQAFKPRPKVGSTVVYIDMESPHQRRADDEMNYRRIVKACFAHKRKTILNSLKKELNGMIPSEISGALLECSIDPSRRAETLSIDEFIELASVLKPDERDGVTHTSPMR